MATPSPDHAPSRALRVLENAAHVDAIIAVAAGLGVDCRSNAVASDAQRATDALRPLTAVVRLARMSAVTAILHSAWSD